MPIIHFNNDTPSKRVSYGSAAQLNTYLEEPDKLNEIKDEAERKKKEDFLLTVHHIDWSDLAKPSDGISGKRHANHDEIQRVLNDKSLKGKAKFDAMRNALGAGKQSKLSDDI